jgi:hypothetical protein
MEPPADQTGHWSFRPLTDRQVFAMTRLLDPRFRYTSSVSTNVANTWKRFGFDAQSNEERRSKVYPNLADTVRHLSDDQLPPAVAARMMMSS